MDRCLGLLGPLRVLGPVGFLFTLGRILSLTHRSSSTMTSSQQNGAKWASSRKWDRSPSGVMTCSWVNWMANRNVWQCAWVQGCLKSACSVLGPLGSEMARPDNRKPAVPCNSLMTLKSHVNTNVESHLTSWVPVITALGGRQRQECEEVYKL